MTLKDYYNGLPEQVLNPRQLFKNEVMQRCSISKKTFHNWFVDPKGKIPAKHLQTIQQIKLEIDEKINLKSENNG